MVQPRIPPDGSLAIASDDEDHLIIMRRALTASVIAGVNCKKGDVSLACRDSVQGDGGEREVGEAASRMADGRCDR